MKAVLLGAEMAGFGDRLTALCGAEIVESVDEADTVFVFNFDGCVPPAELEGIKEKAEASGKETYMFKDRDEAENHLWFIEPLSPGAEQALQALSHLLQ